jgi:hypothetical protein
MPMKPNKSSRLFFCSSAAGFRKSTSKQMRSSAGAARAAPQV